MSYIYTYSGVIVQPHMGKTENWQQMLDDLDEVVWRPYNFIDAWVEDDDELVYFFCPQFFLGQIPSVIEIFFFRRVVRQFGCWQGMPYRSTHYARV